MATQEKAQKTAISPTREEDYAEWYQQVVTAADLAENSPVRGCMVIKPWGYALWENMQRVLDRMIKETGHKNAYFPIFIPKSFLEKEAAHVEGFAKECAVVTHHRLIKGKDGGLIPDPDAELEEPLIVRPTSETIIGEMYAKWVQSYRDLPILINQWANVVRWELRTRLFLRTTEFLWQEGHTAHATAEEAVEEAKKMHGVYETFAREYLALAIIGGRKTPSERFPGAVDTMTIEAMMQDRKALQAGTSHFLGQNFAKASGIKFQSKEGKEEFAWTTSWGVSTRLIGGLIMTHADDDGLVLPPRLAPAHVVLLPIVRDEAHREKVMAYAQTLARELAQTSYDGEPVRVEVDMRDMPGGDKVWDWVKKGVPLRVEIGGREVDAETVSVARRDKAPREKAALAKKDFIASVAQTLAEMQQELFRRAEAQLHAHTTRIASWDAFVAYFTPKNTDKPEIHGGFALASWCGNDACEARMKDKLKVTARCIPFEKPIAEEMAPMCVVCGQKAMEEVVYGKAY